MKSYVECDKWLRGKKNIKKDNKGKIITNTQEAANTLTRWLPTTR